MVDLLEESYGDELAERTELYARGAHRLTSSEGRDLRVSPLGELGGLSAQPATLLVDCAYPTQEQVTALGAEAYVEVVGELREQRRTALEQLRPEAFVSLSSGAAKLFADGLPIPERTKVYGEMKWLDETQMIATCPELGVRLCIARVYAASGPHMTKASSYALGDLIEQARAEQPDRHAQTRSLAHDESRFRGKQLRHGGSGRRVHDKMKIGGGAGGFAAGEMVGGVVVAEKLALPGRVGRSR